MEAIVPYAVMLVLALVGFGLLAIVLFGARSVVHGKINPISIGMISVPVILLLALGFGSGGDWPWAGVMTVLILLGLAVLSLFISSIRGFFT